MRCKKKIFKLLFISIAFIILILDPESASRGTREGIELCLRTVIPSLFPFIILSLLLTEQLTSYSVRFLQPLGKLIRLPIHSEAIFLVGLLGGYPVGAQNIVQAYRNGGLAKDDAERLLPICNNAGPAFIFGIGATLFGSPWICFLVWTIQIISAIMTAYTRKAEVQSTMVLPSMQTITLQEVMTRAMQVMCSVCGWIIMFRVILVYFQNFMFNHMATELRIFICGLLELSNGCCSLGMLINTADQFTLFTTMLGFGGLCVTQQTKSLLSGTDLSFKHYLPGKIYQASICFLLSTVINMILGFEQGAFSNILFVLFAGMICLCNIIFSLNPDLKLDFTRKFLYNNFQTMHGGHTYETVSQKG